MSWKPEIMDAGKWIGNGLVFATKEECVMYSLDLACKWSGAGRYRAVESDRTPTHVYGPGGLVYITEQVAS